jgi:hypothetical protein
MPSRNNDCKETIERNISLLKQGLEKVNRLGAQLENCNNPAELERIRASIRRGKSAIEQFRRETGL